MNDTILGLYWVETADHDEDWFIFAYDERQARHFHEDYEGYGRRTAKATLIMVLKRIEIDGVPRHAQLDDLERLGFVVKNRNPVMRVVERKGVTYAEGLLQSVIEERPNWKQDE